jgi:hypothetical protein
MAARECLWLRLQCCRLAGLEVLGAIPMALAPRATARRDRFGLRSGNRGGGPRKEACRARHARGWGHGQVPRVDSHGGSGIISSGAVDVQKPSAGEAGGWHVYEPLREPTGFCFIATGLSGCASTSTLRNWTRRHCQERESAIGGSRRTTPTRLAQLATAGNLLGSIALLCWGGSASSTPNQLGL